VLVLEQRRGRGRASGIEFRDAHGGGHLFHLARGRVTRLVVYWERARALADLGLKE
jgi:hypothetical protein